MAAFGASFDLERKEKRTTYGIDWRAVLWLCY